MLSLNTRNRFSMGTTDRNINSKKHHFQDLTFDLGQLIRSLRFKNRLKTRHFCMNFHVSRLSRKDFKKEIANGTI